MRKDPFFKKAATGNLPMLQWVYGQHSLDLVFSLQFFGLGGGQKGRGWTWEDGEVNVMGGA